VHAVEVTHCCVYLVGCSRLRCSSHLMSSEIMCAITEPSARLGTSTKVQTTVHSLSLGNNQVEQFPTALILTVKCCVWSLSSVRVYQTWCFLHFAATFSEFMWSAKKPHLTFRHIWTFLLPQPWQNNWYAFWLVQTEICVFFFTKWIGKNELACSSSQTRFM